MTNFELLAPVVQAILRDAAGRVLAFDPVRTWLVTDDREPFREARECTCPDPWCVVHARCIAGHELIICDDDPAFCPTCGHDVMPAGACRVNPPQERS